MPEETEVIRVGGKDHVVEARPIMLLFGAAHNSAGPRYEYPGRLRITTDVTRHHGERVVRLHAEFNAVWRFFFANTTPPLTGAEVPPYDMAARKKGGDALLHLIGLIDFTLKTIDLGIPTAWVHPESFMHPGWTVGLGDLVILFSQRGGKGGLPTTAVPESPKPE